MIWDSQESNLFWLLWCFHYSSFLWLHCCDKQQAGVFVALFLYFQYFCLSPADVLCASIRSLYTCVQWKLYLQHWTALNSLLWTSLVNIQAPNAFASVLHCCVHLKSCENPSSVQSAAYFYALVHTYRLRMKTASATMRYICYIYRRYVSTKSCQKSQMFKGGSHFLIPLCKAAAIPNSAKR